MSYVLMAGLWSAGMLLNLISDSTVLQNKDNPSYMLSILLQQTTGLQQGDKLRAFVSYFQRKHPQLERQLLDSMSESSSVRQDLIATIQHTRSDMILAEYASFNQLTRDELFDVDSGRDWRTNTRLRGRYYLPGDEFGKESKEQIESDRIQTQLFQHTIPNIDAGGNNNSVYLDSKRNEFIRFHGQLGAPRPPNNELSLLLPFRPLHQYVEEQPIQKIMHDKLVSYMGERHLTNQLGHRSVGLQDQINGDILEAVVQLPPPYRSQFMPLMPMKSTFSSGRDCDADWILTGLDTTYDKNNNPMYTQ